jgi:hypothetical protein
MTRAWNDAMKAGVMTAMIAEFGGPMTVTKTGQSGATTVSCVKRRLQATRPLARV